MTESQFHLLLQKYLVGELSAGEHDLFFEAVQDPAWEAVLKQSITQDLQREQGVEVPVMPPHIAQDVLRRIHLAARQADVGGGQCSGLCPIRILSARNAKRRSA